MMSANPLALQLRRLLDRAETAFRGDGLFRYAAIGAVISLVVFLSRVSDALSSGPAPASTATPATATVGNASPDTGSNTRAAVPSSTPSAVPLPSPSSLGSGYGAAPEAASPPSAATQEPMRIAPSRRLDGAATANAPPKDRFGVVPRSLEKN